MEFEKNTTNNGLIILTSGPGVKNTKEYNSMLYEVIFIDPNGKEMKLLFAIPKFVNKEKYLKASLFKLYGKQCELKDYKNYKTKNW